MTETSGAGKPPANRGEVITALYDSAGPDQERVLRAVFCGEALDATALYRDEETPK